MTPEIAGLVLLSAALHPVWNMLIKSALRPESAYLSLAACMGLIGLLHALATGADLLAAWRAWPLLLLSFAGQALYGFALVATLKRGDLSSYYPIIRASPLFIVTVGVLLLGERYPWPLLFGIALVMLGGFALQYRRGSRLLSDPVTLAFALAAMSGTGIYSIADGRLMQTTEPSVALFWVESAFAATYYLYQLWLQPNRRHGGWREFLARPHSLLLPGALAYGSYYLILLAYQLGGNVAAVTSVRQASIPLSVLLGGYFLREGAILRRLAASLVLALGIIVIVVLR